MAGNRGSLSLDERRRRDGIAPEDQRQDTGADVDRELSPEEQEEDHFFAEIGEAPTDSVVHVYKMNVEGRDVKIWKGSPATFDIDSLAKKFGSGDYRVLLYSKIETGQLVRKFGRVISILLSPEDDARIKALRDGKASDASAAPFSLDMLIQAIRAAVPQPTPASSTQNLRELAEIVRIIAPQPAVPVAPAVNPVDMLKLMMEFAREREAPAPSRGAGGYDLLMRVMDKAFPLLTDAMKNGQAALPAPAAASGHAPQPAGAQPSEEDAMIKIRMGLGFLVEQAKRGNDPEVSADVILDNVPEEELRKLFSAPNWLDILANINADVRAYAEWFGKVRAAVEEGLNAPPQG